MSSFRTILNFELYPLLRKYVNKILHAHRYKACTKALLILGAKMPLCMIFLKEGKVLQIARSHNRI